VPTELEHLSDASSLGKLLVLPANVRLNRKVNARYKCSSLFGLVVSNKGKVFYNIDTRLMEHGEQLVAVADSEVDVRRRRVVQHHRRQRQLAPVPRVKSVFRIS